MYNQLPALMEKNDLIFTTDSQLWLHVDFTDLSLLLHVEVGSFGYEDNLLQQITLVCVIYLVKSPVGVSVEGRHAWGTVQTALTTELCLRRL